MLRTLLLALLLSLPGLAAAQEQRLDEPTVKRARALFKDLSADDYELRERSSRALLELGPRIAPTLSQLSEDNRDPEVLSRVSFILYLFHKKRLEKSGPGYLGIFIKDGLDPLTNRTAVEVTRIVENTPAAIVGLKAGDLVTRVNELQITSVQHLIDVVSSFPAGDHIDLTFTRGKVSLTLTVLLMPRPKDFAAPPKAEAPQKGPAQPAPPMKQGDVKRAFIEAFERRIKDLKAGKQGPETQKEIAQLEWTLKQLKAQKDK